MKRNAFTLVELLVVLAIIGILTALLIPAIQAARASFNGREAYIQGVSYDDCPYDSVKNQGLYKIWRSAWKEAEKEGLEIKVQPQVQPEPIKPEPVQPNKQRGSPNLYRSG